MLRQGFGGRAIVTRASLLSLGVRMGAGHGLWSFVAFLFPAAALVRDDSIALAMLLFMLETVMASAVLGVRLAVSHRAMRRDPEADRRLGEAVTMLLLFVVPFSVGCAVLLGAVTFIEVDKGRATLDVAMHVGRAKWMALGLLASAVLDTVIAPVRSVHWLETGVAWQSSRTAVLFLTVLCGWPFMLFTGTTQSFFWIFFALRLLSDVGSLKPGERERIRTAVFEGPRSPDPATRDVAKAPPPFSRAHARHGQGADDPRRLPE